MSERLFTVLVIGLILLQVILLQLAVWAYLSEQYQSAVNYGLLSTGLLALVVGWYLFARHWGGGAGRVGPAVSAPGAAPTGRPSSGDATRALILGTLGFVVTFMVWGSISPLALQFKQLYQLTNTQVSLLIAVPVLLGSLGRLPIGLLADRYGSRPVYALLVLSLVIPLAAMGFTNSYGSLMAVAFFLGLAGTSFAVGVPFVSRWYPPAHQGLALGIFGAGNFGQALGALYAPRVSAALGWPYVYWSLVLPVVLTAAAIWFLGKDAPQPESAAGPTVGGSIWTSPQAWLLSLFYFVSFGGFVAFSNYLPKLYQELHTLTPAQAGSYTAIFVAVATLARPLGGWLSDQITGSKVLIAIFAVALVGALVLGGTPSLSVFALAVGLLALALGLGNGAVFKLVPQYFPGRTGAVTGMVGAMGGLGGFFPPLVMGIVRDNLGSYALGFAGLAGFALVCLIGVVGLTRVAQPRDATLVR